MTKDREQVAPVEEPVGGQCPQDDIVEGELEWEDEAQAEPTVAQLQQQLEEAQAQAAEYLDGWQRARAEFANFRRRQEAEREQQVQMSNAHLLTQLLPVLDDLERALGAVPESVQGQGWLDGILLIKRKLELVLDSQGVRPIETAGHCFDPVYHEAVTYEEAEGYEEDQIIAELQRGYMLGERVLRPAMVRVAQAPASPAEEADVEGEE